jgi:predicted RNA-binding Zn-ribbon protein involved in translation (DUF1610 family)
VDTLRDEACPVCGETDAYDGDECKVCGFVAPPDKFQDPDVDMHKQLDLRGNGDLDSGDVPGLNADINDADGDGLDDNTGEPIGDQQPMLTCPNCGYEVVGGEPQTVSTEDDVMGDASEASPDGPAAGDPCPNCGEAPLMSPEEMAESGLGEPDPEGEDAPPVDEDGNPVGPGDELEDEDPDDPDAVEKGPDDEEDPEMEDRGSPFPDGDDSDDDHSDEDDDSPFPKDDDGDDDEDEDPDDEPASKKFPPGKK